MCGIAGVLSAAPVDPQRVVRMRDALAHRGPDHAGLWQSRDEQVCLGHRRLSILDLSPDANQPFLSSDGRYAITFNGEIYNFAALRGQLAGRGVKFRTRSDTEVLLEAYRAWGARALPMLSGMFAFAIWDAVERTLFCARDRVGEKPFHYAVAGNAFLFASELKALCAWPAFQRTARVDAIADFLTFGFIPDPKTIWAGASKLPPGHWMTVRLPLAQSPIVSAPECWWALDLAPDESVTDWDEIIRDTITSAAREMTVSDVPVGAFLSGGVDSSAVTAALTLGGSPPTTFTVGFAEASHDERPWARLVAQRYGTVHRERIVSANDIAPVMDGLLRQFDEPFNDYSYLPTFYLCREARREITVALSGDGGDELFAGYRKYQRLGAREAYSWLLDRPMVPQLATAGSALLGATNPMRRTIAQYTAPASDSLADMLVTGFDARTLAQHARGALGDTLKHYSPLQVVHEQLASLPANISAIDAMRHLDVKLTLGGGILVKVDRASMAVALEVRPVLLHRDVLALAGRIPARLHANRRGAKLALKHAVEPWLPRELVHRPKQGFALPLDQWLARDGAAFTSPKSAPPMMRELFDESLAPVLAAPQRHGASRAARVHALQFLQGWMTTWNPGDLA